MKVRVISLIVVLVGWWLASLYADSIAVPSPILVFDNFIDQIESGRLPDALQLSLAALLYGGVLSIVIGIPLGILMGVWRPLAQLLEHYFSALYVMALSPVVPLMILWFGFEQNTRVIFILIFTLPQVVITCYQGTRTLPDDLIEVAEAFRADRADIFFKVIIPYEIPFIITALRLGIGRAVNGMVIAELLIAGSRGDHQPLGVLILNYSAALDLGNMLAIVLFIMLLGIITTGIVQWIENVIAPWRQGMVAGSGE